MLQVLLELLLLVLQVLLELLLLVLQVLLEPLLLVLQVLLLVRLQELQFFFAQPTKETELKRKRNTRNFFIAGYDFCCLIIDSFISSRILKKNSDFSKDYCMAEYAKYFDIPPQ